MPADTETVLGLMQRLQVEFASAANKEIGKAIDQFAASEDIGVEERLSTLIDLHAHICSKIDELRAPRWPSVAPELWANRQNRSESPMEFVRRVYSDYPLRGMPRSVFRKIDRKLYQAMTDWLRSNNMPDDLQFVTTKQRLNDRLATTLPLLQGHPIVKEAQRLHGAIRQRRFRAKGPAQP